MSNKELIQSAESWFASNQWQAFPFQKQTWTAFLNGSSGIVNAPTGSGKTYSLLIPILLEHLRSKNENAELDDLPLLAIWISPIRALAKEIYNASLRAIEGLNIPWEVGIRTGDTSTSERSKQLKKPPQILITTPESLHVILSNPGYSKFFANLNAVVADEWHELLGSKRGVQTELALSKFKALNPSLKIWGISATIGNMEEGLEVLLGPTSQNPDDKRLIIKSEIKKQIEVKTIIPDEIENYPWAGHLGIKLLEKVVPLIKESQSCLLFTNTRSQCELWYQKLLEVEPDLAGIIAMHHGSIAKDLRSWVEDALHDGRMKAVVCTSSLDLGVDFRPVETIVQIGSPKGVARFMQRAGRSGHQPGAVSKIYFVPTHSLEIAEGAALREAISKDYIEDRIPYIRSFDVLIQYLMTLAVSEGFDADELFKEIKRTFSFESLERIEWLQLIQFLVHGGSTLQAYDEYQKIEKKNGKYVVTDKKIAQRHKLSIGTIVSDASITIKFLSGKKIGTVEEGFISQLNIGDTFWFAGRSLELVMIRHMDAFVKKSTKKKGKVPSYAGGRMPLSMELSNMLRQKLTGTDWSKSDVELEALQPLFDIQSQHSIIPKEDEFLIEYFKSSEGYHLVMYPFEGRNVHEGLSTLLAKRISMKMPISFSMAMNDYGFELLSEKEMNIEDIITPEIFSSDSLNEDILKTLNSAEMAKRRFRDIARISGLIFTGYPGKQKKSRHLQSSSQLIYEVFHEYDQDNLLFQQTHEEVMSFQLEEARMRAALRRIQSQYFIYSYPEKPTPFAFPIIVDGLSRNRLTSESLLDRIERMKS